MPVLRDVDRKSHGEIAADLAALSQKARDRKLTLEEMAGGVFTISNLGSFGVEAFTPIINPPQTAVLGLGAIRWEPVVLASGQIVAREQMMLSLTFDHRVVDGATGSAFLQTLQGLLEEPLRMLV